jgi:hypothetical protein
MRTRKLVILSFVVLSAIITGCKPPPVDTTPASMVGKWKAEFTAKMPRILLKTQREETISLEQAWIDRFHQASGVICFLRKLQKKYLQILFYLNRRYRT